MNEITAAPAVPDPRKAQWFQFIRCDFDPVQGVASLVYRFDNGPELIERIRFPNAPWPPEANRQAAFEQALRLLHLVAGVSYYKAGLSHEMRFGRREPDPELAKFLTELYVQGLAEFAYVNQVDVCSRVSFPGTGAPPAATDLLLPERALVAMGGGKDSLVGLGLLQHAGIEVQAVCVGQSTLIGDTVKAAGLPLLRIERTLAPELAEMNRLGAWNGHVPVTAINSAILLCASILYGFTYIVFSNERSADEATLILNDGTAVNHQYSKSSAFETGLRELIASHISPDIEYFSILRPFSELEIVRRFCELSEFHSVYSSCNRNFHLDGSRIGGRWCLDCPKCRFAALSLAMFLPPGQVAGMMGGDLLDQGDQADGFRALCGLGRDKPFECVGEAGESRAAMAALAASDDWCDHAVVIALAAELEKVTVPALPDLLAPSGNHSIPSRVFSQLNIGGDASALVKMADFIGRKVGILGLGREGQAAREYLRSVFPELELALICESPPDQAFTAQLGELDRLITGPLSRARLERFDLLVRSPGISPYRPSIQAAMKAGVEITTPSNMWFAAHPGEKTICVSGTKGKSTTSALIAHALRSCGYRASLAGNIGRPLLSCNDSGVDWWVIELSSFQLADLEAKPAVAVMLNLSEDHLDWHGSESVYRRDKLRLVELAGDSPVIVNAADPVLVDALSACTGITWFNSAAGIHVDGFSILDGNEILPLHVPEDLPGPHNLANIAAALSVLKVIGADVLRAAGGISSFQSLPHRLQLVGERDGVRFVNDSIASSPVATAAALQAMSGRPVTLIVGGLDRGLDWTPYMRAFESDMPQAVIAIPDNGPRIIRALQNEGLQAELGFHEAADLAEAVKLAEEITSTGGVVLLSPGAPSFGQFADYRDRGRQFARFCGFELEEKNKAAGQG